MIEGGGILQRIVIGEIAIGEIGIGVIETDVIGIDMIVIVEMIGILIDTRTGIEIGGLMGIDTRQ